MSIQTLNAAPGDFEAWENEITQSRRPVSRAAERRTGREQILRGLGIVRHRSREREA
jgi:hypothetical protein